MHLWKRRFARIKRFESHIERIRISILESLLEEKDSNFQDNESESLKGKSEDFGEKTKGFKSLKGFLKQKVEKRK